MIPPQSQALCTQPARLRLCQPAASLGFAAHSHTAHSEWRDPRSISYRKVIESKGLMLERIIPEAPEPLARHVEVGDYDCIVVLLCERLDFERSYCEEDARGSQGFLQIHRLM